jgi:hypothetical protein
VTDDQRRLAGMTIDEQVSYLEAHGYRLVQRGRVVIPFEAKVPKPDFASRVEGCNAGLIGSGDKLIDDDEQWAHLRPTGARP